jgi:hypothetical protein
MQKVEIVVLTAQVWFVAVRTALSKAASDMLRNGRVELRLGSGKYEISSK